MKQSDAKQAAEVIKKINYINIASITSEGKPWNTPVYCDFDKSLNFYWISWKENQHSINIKNNPNVFITVYDSTVKEGTGFGIYLQGKAKMITNPVDMLKMLVYHYKRKGKELKAVKYFIGKHPRRIYKFTPEKLWVNGDGDIKGEYVDVRKEINISEVGEYL